MNQRPDFEPRPAPRYPATTGPTTRAGADHPRMFRPGSPILEGKDIAGMALAALMALGPLAAVAFGFGP